MTTQQDTIQQTLAEHGVMVKYVRSNVGPTITQHAFELRSGHRVSSLLKLNDDVALALGLTSVRVLVPIPGTRYVGYETPSEERRTVNYYKTCMGSPNPDHALSVPLGVTPSGTVEFMDLTKAPHVLVAGQTGSGKSVCLSTILTYLIHHYSADDLDLYLIDPKRVELVPFIDAPHVKRHATDLSDSLDVLEELTAEMDYRYQLFENYRVRNISEYHKKVGPMSRKILMIDELADLMLTSSRSVEPVEPMIVRLTQLARAAGIHVILATQRPTVNVVTGLIKANVPTRWSFSVAQNVDSKVILDESGAESLYGAGDSLVSMIGQDIPVRVQGIFTDDDTIDFVVEQSYHHKPEPEQDTEEVEAEDVVEADDTHHVQVARPDTVLPSTYRGTIYISL